MPSAISWLPNHSRVMRLRASTCLRHAGLLSLVGRRTNMSTSRKTLAQTERRRRWGSLTSPESDRRCCCSEPLTLTNLLLGPTRSARLPMVTLQLQSLQSLLLVGHRRGSPGSLFPTALPTRRRYSPPDAHPPTHPCVADTLAGTSHS